jgi:hypothetical protein
MKKKGGRKTLHYTTGATPVEEAAHGGTEARREAGRKTEGREEGGGKGRTIRRDTADRVPTP